MSKRKLNDDEIDQPNKRQKIEDKYSDDGKSDEDDFNSEDSRSDEEFHEYQINDLLAPQERYILRKDPYYNNIFAGVYSNDITLQKKRNQADPNPGADLALPIDVIGHIMRYCDKNTIRNLSITAKAFSKASWLWKNLFLGLRWRLPHELKNCYFNRDQKRYNAEIKYDVDWFEECQRNCLNANRIQELINEISRKIYGIMDEYGVYWADENDKSLFYPGLSDSELDEWEQKNNYLLTNDLRQLYKVRRIDIRTKDNKFIVQCCNGTRFRMVDLEGERLSVDWWLEVPNFMLPKLKDITVSNEFSLKGLEKAVDGRSFDSSDEDVNDNLFSEVDPQIYLDALRQRKPSITLKDLEYDGDDSNGEKSNDDRDIHIIEDQQQKTEDSSSIYSDISEHSSENSSDEEEDQNMLPNDDGLKIMLNLGQCRDQSHPDDPWTDEGGTYELMYEPIMGYVFTIKRVHSSDEVRFTSNYRSIVEWLQEISDHLDDPRAHYWILSKSCDPREFSILQKEYSNPRTLDDDLDEYWEKSPWPLIGAELLQDYSPYEYGDDRQFYMPPRCDKLLAAAAQDFMVKVFARANQLETADHLRAETLAIAAQELGLHKYHQVRPKASPEEEKVIDL